MESKAHGYLELRATAQRFQNSRRYENHPAEARFKCDKTTEHFIHCEAGFTFNRENSKDVRNQRPTWGHLRSISVSSRLHVLDNFFFFWKICLLLWKTGMLLLLITTYWKTNVFHIPFIVGKKKKKTLSVDSNVTINLMKILERFTWKWDKIHRSPS